MAEGGRDPTKPVMPFYALNLKTQEKISSLDAKWQVHFDWLNDVAAEAKVKFAKPAPGEERELSLLPKTPASKKSRITRSRKKESLSQADQDLDFRATTSSRETTSKTAKGSQQRIAAELEDKTNSNKKKSEAEKLDQETDKSANGDGNSVKSASGDGNSDKSASGDGNLVSELSGPATTTRVEFMEESSSERKKSFEASEDPEKMQRDRALETTVEHENNVYENIGDEKQESIEVPKGPEKPLESTREHEENMDEISSDLQQESIEEEVQDKVTADLLPTTEEHCHNTENVNDKAQPDEMVNMNSLNNEEQGLASEEEVFNPICVQENESPAKSSEEYENTEKITVVVDNEVINENSLHNEESIEEFVDDVFDSLQVAEELDEAPTNVIDNVENESNEDEVISTGHHESGESTDDSFSSAANNADETFDVSVRAEVVNATFNIENDEEIECRDNVANGTFVVETEECLDEDTTNKTLEIVNPANDITISAEDCETIVGNEANEENENENSSLEEDKRKSSNSANSTSSEIAPQKDSSKSTAKPKSRSSRIASSDQESLDARRSASCSKTQQKSKSETDNKPTRSTRSKQKKLEAEASQPTLAISWSSDGKSLTSSKLKLSNDDTESENENDVDELLPPGKTNSASFETASRRNPPSRKSRRSSIATSLLKVSAARNLSVTDVLQTMDASLITLTSNQPTDCPGRKSPAAKKALGSSRVGANKSRAHAGKVTKPPKIVNRSVTQGTTARGMTPGSSRVTPGSNRVTPGSVGSQNGGRVRSRLGIMEKANRGTPGSSVVSKPRRPSVQEQMEEERKREEKAAEAVKKKEELMKQKTEEKRNKREARIKRVQEARQAKDDEMEKKRNQAKETEEKLAALAKRERRLKEDAEKKRINKEMKAKEDDERLSKEAELEELRNQEATEQSKKIREDDEERKREKERKKEEERKREKERRKEEERRQQYEAKKREAERIAREKENLKKIQAEKELNSTYTKPSNTLLNNTKDAGPTSYNMTPSRHGGNLPPEPLENEDNYSIEDLDSEGSTDDEDRPRKEVPKWAEGGLLRTALLKQSYMGPDLDAIFAPIEMPELAEIFVQKRKRFFKRTSSAQWDAAPTSFKHGPR